MPDDRVLAQIYSEIERIKRRIDQTTESVAFEHSDAGIPTHDASEGVLYWDQTNDNLYVNADGASVWQLIGGGSGSSSHNVLSATHLDSTAAAVTRGALITGQNPSPTWSRLDHPSDLYHYLTSNASEPGWVSDLAMKAGAYVGRTGDVRIRFNSASGYLDLTLGDAAGSDQVRVLDSGSTAVAYIDSDGRGYLAGSTGIGIAPGSAKLHVDQSVNDSSIPVLYLNQADISEEFIRFQGTAASGVTTQSIIDYGDESSSTAAVWLKVYVIDDGNQVTDQAYYLLAYEVFAPS